MNQSSSWSSVVTQYSMGSEFRCLRSTATEMQSTSENDFKCFASNGRESTGEHHIRLHRDAISQFSVKRVGLFSAHAQLY
jgi:hypothetical protein